MAQFRVQTPFQPAGDQPNAIAQLVDGINAGARHLTLLGATATGKTLVMAWIFEQIQRPDAGDGAQQNAGLPAVRRVPRAVARQRGRAISSPTTMCTRPRPMCRARTCTSRKKRRSTKRSTGCATRRPRRCCRARDVLIVASVSAIFGLGSPQEYGQQALALRVGRGAQPRQGAAPADRPAVRAQRYDFHRGTFRVRGDTLDIFPANAETA